MKKLMFVAAVMAAGMCLSDIVSANVVGYQQMTTVQGFNFLAPTFTNVSGEAIPIQSIIPSGDQLTPISDSIQILDAGGATIKTYFWDDGSFAGTGWADADTLEITTDTIAPGQSILIYSDQPGVQIQFSGEVAKEAFVTTSRQGFNFVGNTTPVEVAIQDVSISGSQVTPISDSIQILDEGGATIKTYFWDDGSFAGNGWTDADTLELTTDKLPAGQGVLLYTDQAGVVITFPSAL